eukprot:TRINITY_DN1124_c0_g4_i1.p1 TRINITY_DN1124_c0_g4~~TRINITY_DN1124_c0_g4_i1.p1  ORF type:complete len:207 (-),score=41.81 TRINITY_DN1124_c0_g4_i1:514-1134(-)
MSAGVKKREFDSKIVVIGHAGVGKTCLVLRYVHGTFQSDTLSTIGASFLTKKIVIGNTKLNLQIWDTAGQERFRSMAPMYYRGSSAAILAFDLTSEESFQEMKKWVTELQSRIEHDIILAIACCKVDLEAQRRVSKETVEAYAASIGAILQETSAKTNDGIEDLFLQLSRELIARHTDAYNTTDTQGNTGTRVEEVEPSKKKGCGC